MLSHPVFLSALFSWLIAQLIKTTISALWHQTRGPGELVGTIFWKTGGMPSSHSSMMTGLATAIGFTEGPGTPVFMIAFFFTLVVIRDALGVRRTAGELAQRLNRLSSELARREGTEYQPVREVNGHTAAEVSVGVLLGFFLGVAFSIL
ncbi:MAG: divergent PAP2 family protein [Spirochaetales bacterium]